MQYSHKKIKSPVGVLTLVASERGLVAILWENDRDSRVKLPVSDENPKHPVLLQTEKQLKEYFLKQRKEFAIPLDMHGTDFQKKVWKALQQIPYGKTSSYGELAKKIHNPGGSRAVGAANGRNPVSIIVPCHRVIGANGKLTGFAGGLEIKSVLLNLERENSEIV